MIDAASRHPHAPTILFLNHNRVRSGTYFRNFGLARALTRLGWNATLLSVARDHALRPEATDEAGVRVIRTPRLPGDFFHSGDGCDPLDILFRSFHVCRRRHDVLWISDHLPSVSVPSFLAAAAGRAGLISADWADLFSMGGVHAAWQHGLRAPFGALGHALEIGVKRRAHVCTATSHRLLDLLHTKVGRDPRDTLFVPSGCNPETITEPDPLLARSRWNLPADRLIVGRTGLARLCPTELDGFLAVLARCRTLGLPDPLLLLVGDHSPDWYPEIAAAGAEIRVSGLLMPEDVPHRLAACDFFLLVEPDTPHFRHRGPIRLTDYLTVGRPVLCNPVCDMAPFLSERRAGVVWNDVASPCDEVDRLLTSAETRLAMGRQARALAEGELSWNAIGSRVDVFLRKHLAGK